MRHEASFPLTFVALFSLSLATACSSSTSGGGGNGGAGGATTTTTSGTTSTSSSSGAGGGCVGDATSWATLTQGPIACTQSSDCCVIVNGCINEAQIVSATNEAAAKAAWPYCDNMCTDCIPPAIQVGCDNGVCVGTVVDFADASADLMTDHCGIDVPVGATVGKLHFTCGGG